MNQFPNDQTGARLSPLEVKVCRIINFRWVFCAVILCLVTSLAVSDEQETAAKGLWLQSRRDSLNLARTDVAGKMSEAPDEVWNYPTGGEVRFAQEVHFNSQESHNLVPNLRATTFGAVTI